jgi:hypothetical protein
MKNLLAILVMMIFSIGGVTAKETVDRPWPAKHTTKSFKTPTGFNYKNLKHRHVKALKKHKRRGGCNRV